MALIAGGTTRARAHPRGRSRRDRSSSDAATRCRPVPPSGGGHGTDLEAGIPERIDAHHVVLPEHEMGERVAHLVTGRLLGYIEFEDDYVMIKTPSPGRDHRSPLNQSRPQSKYAAMVVKVKRQGESFTQATADTVVNRRDVLVVAGRTSAVEPAAV
ncbi:hypothetical protein AB0E59_35895 [Lentzea sp. NPDC034063]|uniref:hypothetical protein n=1 Tax=unclassified Lentzea TaxID=2643253 RepID=UPI0033F8C121